LTTQFQGQQQTYILMHSSIYNGN